MTTAEGAPKRKIAILGGGMAGLAAAFELSRTPEQRARYDVTVYTLGWRLGGKLASGRNLSKFERNEEHGLHVWLGFYDNAFALLRGVYDQLPIASTDAFKTWRDAFKGYDFTPIGEEYPDGWTYWPVTWPTNGDEPGVGGVSLSPWGAVTELLSMLRRLLPGLLEHPSLAAVGARTSLIEEGLAAALDTTLRALGHTADLGLEAMVLAAIHYAASLNAKDSSGHGWLSRLLQEFARVLGALVQEAAKEHPGLRAIYHVLVIGVAVLRGMLNPQYRVLETGDLGVIDHLELRAFLKANGGDPAVIDGASELRAFYDLGFFYEEGQLDRPNVAAGAAIRDILRIVLTMKGHVLYLPQAGFGEAAIAPLYRVLCLNGVRFEFFHKVTDLALSDDQRQVEQVSFSRQAETVEGAPYEPIRYDPIKGTWWWPMEPFWDKLVNGEAMRNAGVDFECKWRQPPDTKTTSITRGRDFDDVVLAIAHGAFKKLSDEPTLADALYAASPEFARRIQAQGVVPNQSLQLWTTPTLAGLGFKDPQPAMVAAPELLDVWADMSQTLAFEHWPKELTPGFVAYVCAILPTDLYKTPAADPTVPARARAMVFEQAIAYYEKYTGWMWPNATQPGTQALDYNVLVAPQSLTGTARLDWQWLRANVDPTECCVASLAGTTALRVGARGPERDTAKPPAAPYFVNLYFAGDWTRTVTDTVSVEGAVSSAMAASRAISGSPREIVGEDFFFGSRRL